MYALGLWFYIYCYWGIVGIQVYTKLEKNSLWRFLWYDKKCLVREENNLLVLKALSSFHRGKIATPFLKQNY